MHRVVAITSSLLCLTAIAAPPPTPASGSEAALLEQFKKLEFEWMDALKRGDIEAAAKFLAPEYALRVSGAPEQPTPRKRWIEVARVYKLHEFSQRGHAVQCVPTPQAACDVVVVSLVHTQKADVAGQDRSGNFWTVDVWRKIDGEWKVSSRYTGEVESRKIPTSLSGQKQR